MGALGAGPLIMPRNSEGLYLLQRVRDEAHRFAITYHRSKRSKRMTASALDSVRGLGEHRRKALVTHFGSVARLKDATVEEITAVPGIGVATARAVLEALAIPPDSDTPEPVSAMIRPEHRDDGPGHARGIARRRANGDALNRVSTSSWSPGSPGQAGEPRQRCWRISAGTLPTICRRS